MDVLKKIRAAKRMDRGMTVVFYVVAGAAIALLCAFALTVIIRGFIGFTPELLAFNKDGIGNQLFNTVYLVFLSLLISGPLGIAAGIYMAEYARNGPVTRFLRICIETLSSLPSIVVGLFGYLVFIVLVGGRWSLMAGALEVSILNLPLIATTTEDAFRSLPAGYKRGSLGLGATHWQTIFRVMLPACLPRIITGLILAAGRAFGESAALLYTASTSTDINWRSWNLASPTCPLNPFRPGETLSLHIWAARTESLSSNAEQVANFSSAVLLILVFGFSIGARFLSRRLDKKMGGHSA